MTITPKKPVILIVDDEPQILEILEIIIESELDVQILKASNGQEAALFLEQDLRPDIIVSDYNMPIKNGGYLFQRNKEIENLPFILVSAGDVRDYPEFENFSDSNPHNCFLTKPYEEEELFRAITAPLKKNEHGSIQDSIQSERGLKKIQPHFLAALSKESYDLFIKVGDEKFLQISKKENGDMMSVIRHHQEKEKHNSFFYMGKDDYSDFLSKAMKEVENLLASDQEESKKTIVTFTAIDLAFTVAQEDLKVLGVSKIHQDLINSSMERVFSDLKKNDELFGMLKDLLESNNYLSNHSILNIYFSSYLLKKLGWSTEQTLKQLLLASFYHDIEIQDQSIARISHPNDCKEANQRKVVLAHAQAAADYLDKLPGVNHDAHRIILDHHEKPDGTGFPTGHSGENIPPLSCVFILAHHIIDFLLDNNFDKRKLATEIQAMEGTWDRGNFKRPFSCAREILLD